jgi:hypothetical protein
MTAVVSYTVRPMLRKHLRYTNSAMVVSPSAQHRIFHYEQ